MDTVSKLESKMKLLGFNIVDKNEWAIAYKKSNNKYTFATAKFGLERHSNLDFTHIDVLKHFIFGNYVNEYGENRLGIWVKNSVLDYTLQIGESYIVGGHTIPANTKSDIRKSSMMDDKNIVIVRSGGADCYIITYLGKVVKLPKNTWPCEIVEKEQDLFQLYYKDRKTHLGNKMRKLEFRSK